MWRLSWLLGWLLVIQSSHAISTAPAVPLSEPVNFSIERLMSPSIGSGDGAARGIVH